MRRGELAALIRDMLGHGIDILLIHGASAILDRRDVIPAAIVAAGGRIDHFGMPVDPGNLLLLGHVGERAVLGLPGCARSPKVNGFDWVLERLVAGIAGRAGRDHAHGQRRPPRRDPVAAAAARRGEHADAKPRRKPARPADRRAACSRPGSRRADGRPEQTARRDRRRPDGRARRADGCSPRGRGRSSPCSAIRPTRSIAALGKLPVERVRNPDFRRQGSRPRLKRGIAALPPDLDGVIVCLGDMPLISGRHLDRLIAAFNPLEGRAIVVPTRRGKRGNPVLWSSRFFPRWPTLAGDVGAKHLIGEHAELVAEVEMDDDAVLVDIDTPEALDELSAKRASLRERRLKGGQGAMETIPFRRVPTGHPAAL